MKQSDVFTHSRQYIQIAKNKKGPYSVTLVGTSITIHPGVFPTATDTKLLAEYIKFIPNWGKILDITTGSGAIAVIAGLQGAHGIAIDINPKAVANAKENFTTYRLPINAIESDMFENIPNETFDVILCNAPYYDESENIADDLDYAMYGGKKYLDKLLSQFPKHLEQNGKLLITYAEWADIDYLEELATRYQYKWKVLGKKLSDDRKRMYRLYEISLK